MAKYTELYMDYVNGGGFVPSSTFALIDDFEDLFFERFAGCEIGFETEELFALKLDMRASIVMPVYAKLVASVDASLSAIATPKKGYSETRTYGAQHAENSSDGSNKELPYNEATALDSSIAHTEGSADTDEHEDTIEREDEIAAEEAMRTLEALQRKKTLILNDCLEEFANLFMKVY